MVKTLTEEAKTGAKIVIEPERKKKGRRGRRRSTRVMKGIRRAERQAVGVFRDVPSNIIGLRRKPRIIRTEPKLREYGITEERRTNAEIMEEFLS